MEKELFNTREINEMKLLFTSIDPNFKNSIKKY